MDCSVLSRGFFFSVFLSSGKALGKKLVSRTPSHCQTPFATWQQQRRAEMMKVYVFMVQYMPITCKGKKGTGKGAEFAFGDTNAPSADLNESLSPKKVH